MSRLRKTVTIDERYFDEAEKKAIKYFGGNFSAYVNFIIANDLEDNKQVIAKESIKETAKEVVKQAARKNPEVEQSIDRFMGGF